MSVDFYAVVPADAWPSVGQVQQCVAAQGYPIVIERFPAFDTHGTNSDGALVRLKDGSATYLEGELFLAIRNPQDVTELNDRLRSTSDLRIGKNDAVMSIRTRSPSEMRAASYVIASVILCFDGFGFEPQGNSSGRADFAKSMLAGAKQLEDVADQ